VGRWFFAVLVAVACALFGAGRASAFSTSEIAITTDDNVKLAATLYEPDGAPPPQGWPALVLFHGLGGDRQSLDSIAQGWANTFAVLSFDARGHGESGGLSTIDGPREIQDTREVFNWLGARPEIDRKHIGAWGISLGGGAVLRSLGLGVPWAAVEVVETWTNLYGALAPQNLTKSGAIYSFLNSLPQDRLDPSVLAIKDDALASKNLGALRSWARVRSSGSLLSKVKRPVYFFQGRRDFAFDIDQARNGYKLVKGPKRLYIGDFGHSPSTFPGPDIKQVLAEGTRWFSRYLLGVPTSLPRSPFSLSPDPWRGKVRTFRAAPKTLGLKVSFRGRNVLTGVAKTERTTGRLPGRIETFGVATVRVPVRLSGGWSRLVAVLTATTPRKKVVILSEGGINTVGKRGARWLTIRLLDTATLVPRGSRLTLTLASSSMAQDPGNLLYLDLPMPAGARITLGPARLTLPVLRRPVSR
jgi:predicted acyl esterase